MFEDIYKKTDSTSYSPMFFSTDFTEDLWEEMKKDPKKLGDTIEFIVNGIGGAMSKDHMMVFTGFQFRDDCKKLNFDFEIYDLSDKEERKTYLDKKKHEENMGRLDELKDVKPGGKNDEVIPTMGKN